MHFVAMLGIQMPVLFYYYAAITLASALLAILIVGSALLLLHFRERTPVTLSAAGALVGFGILAMHYVGMAGLQLCRAVYTSSGIFLAVVSAVVLCIEAFWIACGQRTNRSILLGTLCFGTAVSAVHFAAMAGTNFVAVPTLQEFGPAMSNETLAMGVILSSFVIFGAFLWVGATFLDPTTSQAETPFEVPAGPPKIPAVSAPVRIPCQRNGAVRTEQRFVLVTSVDIKGGSARDLGSLAVVNDTGEMTGYMSNGCIDQDILLQALECLQLGSASLLRYGYGSPFHDLTLPCGGALSVWIDPAPDKTALVAAYDALLARAPASLTFHPKATGDDLAPITIIYQPKISLTLAGRGGCFSRYRQSCSCHRI
jgi:NO-binding membrane sensor protein with MHYT domain